MFKSKIDNTTISQSEHQKLSGIIASLWGNENFERPNLDFDALVKGIATHDRGYGELDNYPLGEVDYPTWEAIMKKGLYESSGNPITDVIACLHIKRLAEKKDKPADNDLVKEAEKVIDDLVKKNNLNLDELLWADKITNFCDVVAFDFSFRDPTVRTMPIFNKHNNKEPISVTYKIDKNGNILISPWPLSVQEYSGTLTVYRDNNYQVPEIINFKLKLNE